MRTICPQAGAPILGNVILLGKQQLWTWLALARVEQNRRFKS
jgi:hypothetical protein